MSLWTTKLVRHFISTRFGIEHCRERVRQLLHELGFRVRRLRHRHLQAKPEEQLTFVAELEGLLQQAGIPVKSDPYRCLKVLRDAADQSVANDLPIIVW